MIQNLVAESNRRQRQAKRSSNPVMAQQDSAATTLTPQLGFNTQQAQQTQKKRPVNVLNPTVNNNGGGNTTYTNVTPPPTNINNPPPPTGYANDVFGGLTWALLNGWTPDGLAEGGGFVVDPALLDWINNPNDQGNFETHPEVWKAVLEYLRLVNPHLSEENDLLLTNRLRRALGYEDAETSDMDVFDPTGKFLRRWASNQKDGPVDGYIIDGVDIEAGPTNPNPNVTYGPTNPTTPTNKTTPNPEYHPSEFLKQLQEFATRMMGTTNYGLPEEAYQRGVNTISNLGVGRERQALEAIGAQLNSRGLGTGGGVHDRLGMDVSRGVNDMVEQALSSFLVQNQQLAEQARANTLGYASQVGSLANELYLTERGQNQNYDLGMNEQRIREMLGLKELDLQQLLGMSDIELRRQLGLGGLGIEQGNLNLATQQFLSNQYYQQWLMNFLLNTGLTV